MIHDTSVSDAQRNMRLKPEAYADLMGLKRHLVQRHRLGLISAKSVGDAFAEAVRQMMRNDAALVPDDREWTPVRCRGCGNTTSVLKGTTSWACRCFATLKREAFVDAIGADGKYLLDAHAHIHRPSAQTPDHEVAAAVTTA